MRGNLTTDQYNNVKNILKTSFNVRDTKTTIIAEWNHNRYTPGIVVSTNGDHDSILFPKESIVEPRRPTKSGIVKGYFGIPLKTAGYVGKVYPVDEDDYYKHWKSGIKSSSTFDSSGNAPVSENVIEVNYGDAGVVTNKIRIQLEATYVNIRRYTIDAKINGTWRQIANQENAKVDGVGGISIYLQDDNNWSNAENITNDVKVQSVRFRVTALNVRSSRLQIIEISARLRQDLSSRLTEAGANLTEELSDTEAVAPLGAASSNTGNLTLFNNDRALNSENKNSIYYGLIDKNTQMQIYFTVGGVRILMATMHVQNWSNQDQDEVSVELEDCTSFLKNITMPKIYLENRRVGEIITYILNKLGFTNYNFKEAEDDVSQVIPYFWTDGESSAWQIISDLARATQTAVWVDEFDEINVQSRREVYKKKETPDWEFSNTRRGLELSDIESYAKNGEYEANVVKANYQSTDVSAFNNGYPKMETVWEQQDTMVLRSSALRRELSRTDGQFLISAAESQTWPYSGIVNINGEYIKYDGKEYAYYLRGGRVTYRKVDSKERKDKLDQASDPAYRWKNGFTGKMYIEANGKSPIFGQNIPSGRGAFGSRIPLVSTAVNIDAVLRNTYNRSMNIDGTNWDKTFHRGSFATHFVPPKGNFYTATNSCLRITTDKTWNTSHQLLLRSLTPNGAVFMGLGTRLKMNSSTPNKFNEAGLFFKQGGPANGSNNAGCWFVTVVPTNSVLTGFGKSRKEVNIWKRSHTGVRTLVATADANIFQNTWYDLDVRVITEPSRILISVFLNGRLMINYTGERNFNTGPYSGLMAGGYTQADYEYYYNTNERYSGSDALDGSGTYDKRKGDFTSGTFDMDYKGIRRYDARKRLPDVFTDFGANVHEVREIEVNFEPSPVQHSRLFLSNEQIVCPEYSSDAFGAKFVLINASRESMVANGEDKTTFGANNPIDQKLLIYGRKINQEDEQEIEERDEDSIRTRGEVETVFSSPYIQTKSFAQELASWIRSVWAKGSIESRMKVFGNPTIKIGSIVTINYPDKNMTDSKQHIVTGIDTVLGKGIETQLTLRSIV